MNDSKTELVEFRLQMAEEAFEAALSCANGGLWNSAANRLYYAGFYLVIALFAKNDIKTSTHAGVRTILGLHFIQTEVLDKKWGKFFSKLFDMRQAGDYGDFKIFF